MRLLRLLIKIFKENLLTTEIRQPEAPSIREDEIPYPPVGYAWYVVGVLTLVYIFSFLDRVILALLVKHIKRDFHINDTQISFLTSFAFVVFYILGGIPFGRLADSKSRRTIIAFGVVLWSLMTALCGVAQNFFQMFLYRIGVGVGESSLSPSAFSLITDYFPKKRLATAISVYSMGIYLGAGMANLLGGIVTGFADSQETYNLPLLGTMRSWQVIFFIIGLPGVLLALLLYTVKEPARRDRRLVQSLTGAMKSADFSLRQVFDYIRENKLTFICHNVGFGLISLATNAGGFWNPSYFVRNHGWTPAKSGIVLGLGLATAGTAGIVAAGRFSDWLSQRGYQDAPMRVGLLASCLLIPSGAAFYLAPSGEIAAWLFVPLAFFASAPFGVAPAAIQQMMPNAMRGQASALYIFMVNVIGLGLGPTAVALMNDYVFHDDNAIKFSLLIVGAIAEFFAALLLWFGLKPFAQSLDRLKQWMTANTESVNREIVNSENQ
ncbi:MAG: MFS transporter [Acidobacteria bacterium]|nr:MFS transporter [Acidobacteriota bacterium]